MERLERALKEHAYSMTMIAQAMITVEGMKAENNQHQNDQPYSEKDFQSVINQFGINHNAILSHWSDI